MPLFGVNKQDNTGTLGIITTLANQLLRQHGIK
jgi:hypothetical protein